MTDITKSTLSDNLTAWTEFYKSIFGNNFVITPESVISNIATACSAVKMDFEDQLLFVKSMLNPYTSIGTWQDNLYALVKLARQQATYTVVQRTISGTANTTITAGTLMIEDDSSKNQFKLSANCALDGNGIGTGTFISELSGAVELPTTATLNILTPLADVSGVYYSSGNVDIVGVDYESNEQFRQRWKNWADSPTKLYSKLLEIVNSTGDILIEQNRGTQVYNTFPVHTIHVILNSSYDDATIGKIILDNTTDGVGLYGSTSVSVLDDAGQSVSVSFDRATPVNIYVKTTIVKKSDAISAEAQQDALNAIEEYINDTNFAMGQTLVGNRFNALIDAKETIDYVVKTQLSKDGTSYSDTISLTAYEVPVFDTSRNSVVIQ